MPKRMNRSRIRKKNESQSDSDSEIIPSKQKKTQNNSVTENGTIHGSSSIGRSPVLVENFVDLMSAGYFSDETVENESAGTRKNSNSTKVYNQTLHNVPLPFIDESTETRMSEKTAHTRALSKTSRKAS